MFDKIESFKLDHNDVTPGVYLRYTKDDVATWDIRFKKPNGDNYIKPEVMHSLEHFLATYFKNALKEVTYGVFPMGCCTGFYILTKSCVSKRTMLLGLLGSHAYITSSDEVPGVSEESCGNYKFQDLEGAKLIMNEFYNDVLVNAELEIYEDLLSPLNNEEIKLEFDE